MEDCLIFRTHESIGLHIFNYKGVEALVAERVPAGSKQTRYVILTVLAAAYGTLKFVVHRRVLNLIIIIIAQARLVL